MTKKNTCDAQLPVIVTEPVLMPADHIAQLEWFGPVFKGPFKREELKKAVSKAGVLMVRLGHQVDREILEAAPNLKIIISATTGLDHIDIPFCHRRSIDVVSNRGESEFLSQITSTAELAFGLIITIARNIVPGTMDVQMGNWRRDVFRGIGLSGKTLGIIGLGRLGSMVAKYADAFSMKVIACDPNPNDVPAYVKILPLEEVLAQSDILSLHASHSPGDPPLLNGSTLKKCAHGVFIVNTARGELVDEVELIKLLREGQIAGYATDVLSSEATYSDILAHPLVQFSQTNPNVVIVPHIGGATTDGMILAENHVIEKAIRKYELLS